MMPIQLKTQLCLSQQHLKLLKLVQEQRFFATEVEDDNENKAFISTETNFIADVEGSTDSGSQAIIGILNPEENGDGKPRVVLGNVQGTVREMIMTTINDVTYNFNRTLPIANYQLTYDPTRDTGYYPDIVYQTSRGDKITVIIKKNNTPFQFSFWTL